MNVDEPEPVEPGSVSDPVIPLRANPTHGTAIALRLRALAEAYPQAVIWGSTLIEPYADLVAWGCVPGKVWVWTFVPDSLDEPTTDRWVADGLAWARAEPLSGGLRVTPGPPFADLSGPDCSEQSGSNLLSPDQLVTVADSGRDGLQIYRTAEQDPDSAAARHHLETSLHASSVASGKKRQAVAAGDRARRP